jgi:threonine dehydrogenase-like Zn-dependent dehydrogenase
VPAVDGSGKCYTVGCNYTGTIVQLGNRVTKNFKEGDHVAVSTYGVTSVGSKNGCLREHCVGEGSGYYDEWRRVDTWPSRTS